MECRKIDWTAIETEYITGRMSYRDIAESKGISLSAIKAHGVQGGWNQKRKEHRQDCTARTIEKTAESSADKLAELQLLLLDTALAMADRLNKRIREAENMKPAEMLQYARVLVALNEFVPDGNKEEDQSAVHGFVCYLPERTKIDPPPEP